MVRAPSGLREPPPMVRDGTMAPACFALLCFATRLWEWAWAVAPHKGQAMSPHLGQDTLLHMANMFDALIKHAPCTSHYRCETVPNTETSGAPRTWDIATKALCC